MKILFICQWFPPEYAPIGVMIKELGDDLSRYGHKITILTGFPNHPRGIVFPGYRKSLFLREKIGNLDILRTYEFISPRKSMIVRLLNFLSFTLSSMIVALFLKKQDLLFVVSPPLTLGLSGYIIKLVRKTRFIFNIQDIYPDAAIRLGVIQKRSVIHMLRRLEKFIYHQADMITVISDGFSENLLKKGISPRRIRVAPNWIDTEEIILLPRSNDFSQRHQITNKFVVLYSGTIGAISGAEIMLDVARSLQDYKDILFLFVGEGVIRERLEQGFRERKTNNVMFLPFQQRKELSAVLASSDLTMITLLPGLGHSSFPSKVLGYMAAAKPILASVDMNSDVAKLIREAACGKIVEPDNSEKIAEEIKYFYGKPSIGNQLGQNGRRFIENKLNRKIQTRKYEFLFLELLASVPSRKYVDKVF